MRDQWGKGLMAPRAGFEPATIRLTVECSTTELPRNMRTRRGATRRSRITKPFRLAKDENRLLRCLVEGRPVDVKTPIHCPFKPRKRRE